MVGELKGKVFDGFQSGTPTVITPIGAEGIAGSEEWGCKVSDVPEEFAKTAVEIYTNKNFWKKVQSQGNCIIEKRFRLNHWSPRLKHLIETKLARTNEDRVHQFVGCMLRDHQHRSTEYMSRWIEEKKLKPRNFF